MCGVTGFIDPKPHEYGSKAMARIMADALAHRGPDRAGTWADDGAGIAFGHRRLAVLDLSSAGDQPMHSASGRYVIAFNGEIYNHLDVRHQLDTRYSWRGHSDTETLLAAVEMWGLETTLRRTSGMFAFALWDRSQRTLHLCRDRTGEKPMYYGVQNGVLMFGSELMALRVHPAFAGEIDRSALALLLRYSYIPAPWSIYTGVLKLPPASCVSISTEAPAASTPDLAPPRFYWSHHEAIQRGAQDDGVVQRADQLEVLHRALLKAVRRQMVADVPLGAFLSGGIDSSTVVALMQAQSQRAVRTFTVGFHEQGLDEAPLAKAVARHLGTEHTELYVGAREALDVVPRLPILYDEPFADSSQIPTALIAGMARSHVTVAISGDGGDELFGGYGHYHWLPAAWRWLEKVPNAVAKCMVRALQLALRFDPVRPFAGRALATSSRPPSLPAQLAWPRMRSRAHKIADLLACSSPEALLSCHLSRWLDPDAVVCGSAEPPTLLTSPALWPSGPDLATRYRAVDAMSYLPDDILVKIDRAAMAVGLETRAPFLDPSVVELAWKMPMAAPHDKRPKWALRQILNGYVPAALVERPKAGFNAPLAAWLRGPLRDWAETLLEPARLAHEGFFRPDVVRHRWREHILGRGDWDRHLWCVLMFQSWFDHTVTSRAVSSGQS